MKNFTEKKSDTFFLFGFFLFVVAGIFYQWFGCPPIFFYIIGGAGIVSLFYSLYIGWRK